MTPTSTPTPPTTIALTGLEGHDPAGGLDGTQQVLSTGDVLLGLWWCIAVGAAVTIALRVVVLPLWRRAPRGGRRLSPWYLVLLAPMAAVLALVRANFEPPAEAPRRADVATGLSLTASDLELVAAVVGEQPSAAGSDSPGVALAKLEGVPVYVALRRNGVLLAEGWTTEDGTLRPLTRKVDQLGERARVTHGPRPERGVPDAADAADDAVRTDAPADDDEIPDAEVDVDDRELVELDRDEDGHEGSHDEHESATASLARDADGEVSDGDDDVDPVDTVETAVGPGGAPDTIELAFAHSFEPVPRSRRARPFGDSDRGKLGIEVIRPARGGMKRDVVRISPTAMLATNVDSRAAVKQALARLHRKSTKRVQVRTFEAEQVLISLDARPVAQRMVRGNTIVGLAEVTRPRVERLADLAAAWLERSLQADGRMIYGREPSKASQELAGDNMVRQWMATLALERVAARRGDRELWKRVAHNIDYDLAHFFALRGELGLIRYEGTAKLGAISLAALALRQHPERARWAKQLAALDRAIDAAWHSDGSFTTFLEPATRTGQNNFYPGETLLYWASRIEAGEAGLLPRFMQSFRYYRRWHLRPDNRNPAFVPWHTQAYYTVWRHTKDPELAAFVFEMNDWLLGVQDWASDPKHADNQGRFYDPDRPFGPPHASSDGVYLEGLIDAHAMAVELGDTPRASTYRRTLRRVLRYLLQLQFDDHVDLFYVADRDSIHGAIRTTPWDSRIRVDNVQHALMGLIKLLSRWDEADFASPTGGRDDRGGVDATRSSASLIGTAGVHAELARHYRDGGKLVVNLVRIADGHVVASTVLEATSLPVTFGLPTSGLDAASIGEGVFVDASYVVDGAPTLRGELWGAIGKPYPMTPPFATPLQLVFQRIETPASAPVPLAPTAGTTVDDPILVRGTIRPSPSLDVRPGGFVHIRLISLDLGRPFAFRRIEKVQFPLTFELRARDQFYPRALERATIHRFYVDVTYNPPGLDAEYGLFRWESPAVAGEAWSELGVPHALSLGDTLDVVLDRYWTTSLLKGDLAKDPAARAEGWIYVLPALRAKVSPRNRLVLVLRAPSKTGVDRVVAVKVYRDVDPSRPLAYHLTDDDFRIPVRRDLRVYYSVWLESVAPDGTRVTYAGGRADRDTPISPEGHDLRVPVTEAATVSPEAAVPDLARVPLSRPTYR